MRLTTCLPVFMLAGLAACQPVQQEKVQSAGSAETRDTSQNKVESGNSAAKAVAPTLVAHQPTLEKIIGNSGISLQWLSWEPEDRGQLKAYWRDKTLYLKGGQAKAAGSGSLSLDGRVVAVTKDGFSFHGTISIQDTPDAGRDCVKEGMSNFAITQNRRYFRLREFEWCDSLTDYVDIYF